MWPFRAGALRRTPWGRDIAIVGYFPTSCHDASFEPFSAHIECVASRQSRVDSFPVLFARTLSVCIAASRVCGFESRHLAFPSLIICPPRDGPGFGKLRVMRGICVSKRGLYHYFFGCNVNVSDRDLQVFDLCVCLCCRCRCLSVFVGGAVFVCLGVGCCRGRGRVL